MNSLIDYLQFHLIGDGSIPHYNLSPSSISSSLLLIMKKKTYSKYNFDNILTKLRVKSCYELIKEKYFSKIFNKKIEVKEY